MSPERAGLELVPRVVPADSVATITIRSVSPSAPPIKDGPCELAICPAEEIGADEASTSVIRLTARPRDGVLQIPLRFQGEQEYRVRLTWADNAPGDRPIEFRLYAIGSDLFERRPWKGDLHLHSHRSDGQEAPARVAAHCRRIGMDFMAVTDHSQYEPSLEAIRAFENLDVALRIYPGEEVHPPENRIHLINFGGRFSLNAIFERDPAGYRTEVRAIEADLDDLPSGPLRYQYASSVWCCRKIREAGGLAVFCHPYWVTEGRYNVPEILIARHFDDRPFDAFEVIGGYFPYEVESNLLQVARYHEERRRKDPLPVVGASDAHGCENGRLFGWYYTIVFCRGPELSDLIQGVKGGFSVAVEALPGQTARAHGPFRLVKFAHFLLREVFPDHDALCEEEGRLMLGHLAGAADAVDRLEQSRGRTVALYDRIWA
jgi:hypothetical protein